MKFLALLPLAMILAACTPSTPMGGPVEPATGAICALDGMTLADHPGPKGQIHYTDGATDYFCDSVELLSLFLAPEQVRKVEAAYVQDMTQADWNMPKGHWIRIDQAFYVEGSKRLGSMGPTLASFGTREAAQAFARDNGGTVLAFADITPDRVQLDGGADARPETGM